MKNYIYLVALIIFISGCIGGGSGTPDVQNTSKDVLVIENFEIIPNTAFQGETVSIIVDYSSKGTREIENIRLVLLGLNQWDDIGDRTKDIQSLASGNFNTQEWTGTAPNIGSGISGNQKAILRTYYEYETFTSTNMQLISNNEYNTIRRSGEAYNYAIETKNSDGPVIIKISNINIPLRYDNEENNDISIPFTIEIINQGSGKVFDYKVRDDEFPNRDNLDIVTIIHDRNDDDNIKINKDGELYVKCTNDNIKLRENRGRATCSVTLREGFLDEQDIIDFAVKLNLKYKYLLENEATVNLSEERI